MSSFGHRLYRTESGRLRGVRGASCAGFVLALAALGGCASAPPSEAELAYVSAMSPTVEMATSAAEEQALERAPALPPGEPTEVGGGVVVGGPVYTAASGRRCRELTFGAHGRLACEAVNAEGWVFVPNVFTAETPSTGGSTDEPTEPAEGSDAS